VCFQTELVSEWDIRKIVTVLRIQLLALTALLSFALTGCQTTSEFATPFPAGPPRAAQPTPRPLSEPPAPLATVTVPEELPIAPAAPLVAPPSLLATSPPPVAVSAPAIVPPHPSAAAWPTNWVNVWIPLESWGKYNRLGKPRQVASRLVPSYEFHTSNGVVSLQMGSRIALYNGLECWLGFAPQIIKGMPCIHWLDAQKNLQPLLDTSCCHFHGERTIVIDPGHGGRDVGTKSVVRSEFEKDYTLDCALRLRRLLVTNGWNVLLTRTNDLDVSLSERVAIAERAKADLFLSLHFNSGTPNRALAGVETYCLTPVGMPSSLVRDYEDNVHHEFPNNAYDEQNYQLAWRMHRTVVQTLRAADRGVRRARFMGVLRGQNRPAVLIEIGYLSNTAEARSIAGPEYRQKLAEAAARALE
jgi:N-acetylmuramoyl-L-alanine amidase